MPFERKGEEKNIFNNQLHIAFYLSAKNTPRHTARSAEPFTSSSTSECCGGYVVVFCVLFNAHLHSVWHVLSRRCNLSKYRFSAFKLIFTIPEETRIPCHNRPHRERDVSSPVQGTACHDSPHPWMITYSCNLNQPSFWKHERQAILNKSTPKWHFAHNPSPLLAFPHI